MKMIVLDGWWNGNLKKSEIEFCVLNLHAYAFASGLRRLSPFTLCDGNEKYLVKVTAVNGSVAA
jgi:hypothetical protein